MNLLNLISLLLDFICQVTIKCAIVPKLTTFHQLNRAKTKRTPDECLARALVGSECVLSRTNLAYTVASFKEMEEDLKSPCANFLFCVLTSRYSFIMMRHNDYHRNKELKSSHDLSFVFTYCILGRQPLRPVSRSGALG